MTRAKLLGTALLIATAWGCSKDEDMALVWVKVQVPESVAGPTKLRLVVGKHEGQFQLVGLTAVVERGVYVAQTGMLPVTAVAEAGIPCTRWRGAGNVDVTKLGSRYDVTLTLLFDGPCPGAPTVDARADTARSPDAGADMAQPPPDLRPNDMAAAPDMAQPSPDLRVDTPPPDIAPDIAPDLAPDLAPDTAPAIGPPPSLMKCTEYDHLNVACTPGGPNDISIYSVGFTPDGTLAASTGFNGRVKLWKVTPTGLMPDGREFMAGYRARTLAFSPDGQYLAVGRDDGVVMVWDVPRGQLHGMIPDPGDAGSASVAFSPTGGWLVYAYYVSGTPPAGRAPGEVRAWSMTEKTIVRTVALPSKAWSIAVGPREDTIFWVAVGLDDGSVNLVDLGSMVPSRVPFVAAMNDGVNTVAFTPDGNTLAVGTDDGLLQLWDTTNRRMPRAKGTPLITVAEAANQAVYDLAFSADGKHLLAAAGAVKLFAVQPQTAFLRMYRAMLGGPFGVAFSPDGRGVLGAMGVCSKVLYCRD